MASCSRCTRTLPDGAKECPFCGKKCSAAQTEPQQDHLYRLRKNLQKERAMWRIYALFLVAVAFFALLQGVLSFLSRELITTIGHALTIVWCVLSIWIDFRQFRKLEEFIDGIYVDCLPALERAEGVGSVVFAAFFSPLAMIMAIANHTLVKNNKARFYTIRQRQFEKLERTFQTDYIHQWD